MTIEEDRLIYIPQGYVFDEDYVHVVKHLSKDHIDNNKDSVCDMCGLDVNTPDEPQNDKPSENTLKKLGDIDGDNKVTASDARTALRMSVKLEKITEAALKLADTDNDGKITAADARHILRTSVKLEKEVVFTQTDFSKEEIAELYKKGLKGIKEGKAGYTLKRYQSLDDYGSSVSFVKQAAKGVAKGMITEEKDAEERVFSKGSDQSMYMIANWTLKDMSMVKSAECKLADGNYEITIVIQDEDSPRKSGSILGQVTGDITYFEDIECTLTQDPTIKKLLTSYNDLHVIYKDFTIKAVMTPEGEFISLEHTSKPQVIVGEAKVLGLTVKNYSLQFSNYFKCYDFVY